MNQVLSQSEVDALLAAVSEGEVGSPDAGGGGGGGGGGGSGLASSSSTASTGALTILTIWRARPELMAQKIRPCSSTTRAKPVMCLLGPLCPLA